VTNAQNISQPATKYSAEPTTLTNPTHRSSAPDALCPPRSRSSMIWRAPFQTTGTCVTVMQAVPCCSMVLKGFLYNTVFRRNSTYAAFIVAGAVLGEKFLNDVVDSQWQAANKGVWPATPSSSYFAPPCATCFASAPPLFFFAVSYFHMLFRNFSMTKSSLKASEIGSNWVLTAVDVL
jgi:hypothetical protein